MSQDTNDTIGLSRRKVLAGLGAVGVASAGAGLGTTAYFNDTETFEGNTLTAGQFDLLLDWQQTYTGPNGLEQINAYPDSNGDSEQDIIPDFGGYLADWVVDNGEYDLRAATDAYKDEYFADLPDDFAGPLIELDDVKPGDHGEVTFSAHLFDNPGYLRVGGDLIEDKENGQSEPEAEVDETTGEDEGELAESIDVKFWYDDGDNAFEGLMGDHDTVIVFDRSYSMVETDPSLRNTNDQYNPQKLQDAVDGAISLVDQLEAANANLSGSDAINISVVTFGNDAQEEVSLGTDYAAARSFLETLPDSPNFDENSSEREGTQLAEGIEAAHGVLEAGDSEGKCMVVLGDGVPSGGQSGREAAETAADDAKADGATIYTVQYDLIPAVDANNASEITAARDLFEYMASDANGTAGPREKLSFGTVPNNVAGAFQHIALHKAGEVCLFEGKLSDFLDSDGLLLDAEPLLTLEESDAAGQGGIDDTDETRPTVGCPDVNATPFSACSTYYFGFEWSIDPEEVGNEIQTDSIVFDIGFGAEQARHNENPFGVCESGPPVVDE
ncbi:VWA domain-containing protein [Halorubrum sp. GN11_10-6_MGM]|uniref:VWA domain-containing protein n=1 Tax=Halorubrum sp. GN11_10-6_MGM TaxID=2518112 RepID=UPI0010F7163E|nr:VWA domain-containing protein [Halorubrum sp. GN11_10-6_MGM]TKX74430.1 VWA domain-containing protein [Halorubrum sp. GN11_10-6_MGM]